MHLPNHFIIPKIIPFLAIIDSEIFLFLFGYLFI